MENLSKQERLELRLGGKLPEVSIAGNLYRVDLISGFLWSLNLHYRDLSVKELYEKNNRFLYDKNGKVRCGIDPDSNDFPEDVQIIEIPYPVVLDPVGFARMNGMKNTDLLSIYPIRFRLEAKIIPWRMTRYRKIIEENIGQIEREKQRKREAKGYHQKNKKTGKSI